MELNITVVALLVIILVATNVRRSRNAARAKGRVAEGPWESTAAPIGIQSPFEPKRLEIPLGPDGTYASNMGLVTFRGERLLFVRFICYKLNPIEGVSMNEVRVNHCGLFSLNESN